MESVELTSDSEELNSHIFSRHDYILYDSLSEEETFKLKNKCISRILRYNKESNIQFDCLCCAQAPVEVPFCSNLVLQVIDFLSTKDRVYKLFYGNFHENLVKDVANAINNESLDIEAINSRLLAQALLEIIKTNEITILPYKVYKLLYKSYVENDRLIQKGIIKLIPFILSRNNRQLFILLRKLIYNIDKNKEITNTTKKELLEKFGPIIFKEKVQGLKIIGFHRMQILSDLLDTDFHKLKKEDLR